MGSLSIDGCEECENGGQKLMTSEFMHRYRLVDGNNVAESIDACSWRRSVAHEGGIIIGLAVVFVDRVSSRSKKFGRLAKLHKH